METITLTGGGIVAAVTVAAIVYSAAKCYLPALTKEEIDNGTKLINELKIHAEILHFEAMFKAYLDKGGDIKDDKVVRSQVSKHLRAMGALIDKETMLRRLRWWSSVVRMSFFPFSLIFIPTVIYSCNVAVGYGQITEKDIGSVSLWSSTLLAWILPLIWVGLMLSWPGRLKRGYNDLFGKHGDEREVSNA